ncbi:MAG: hypothetical protein M3044_10850 [Thermoproteota archaeon]|nr:hypothetical protein [Thermoproteota archaeon]
MTIGEKRPCTKCNKEVEIVDEVKDGNIVHQRLSCGDTSDRTVHRIEERLSLKELVQDDIIRVQTLTKEGAPMQVSGSTGISQMISLAGFQGTLNNTGELVIDLHDFNFNYSPSSISTTSTTITAFNNLQDIFSEIDKSDSSLEEKEKAKGVLSKVYNELKSLGRILTVAAPLVPPLVDMLLKGRA